MTSASVDNGSKHDYDLLDREFPPIAGAIKDERVRQIRKWGDLPLLDDTFCRVLGEEFGEVCAAVEEAHNEPNIYSEISAYQHLKSELVQVAAVAVRFIQSVEHHLLALEADTREKAE